MLIFYDTLILTDSKQQDIFNIEKANLELPL